MHLGGRVAEERTPNDISTGAANDLAEATHLARQMVQPWAMSDRLGPTAWDSDGDAFGETDLAGVRPYSDETAHAIDNEVERLLTGQHDWAREILGDHRTALEAGAEALIEHETLSVIVRSAGALVARVTVRSFASGADSTLDWPGAC